MYDAFSTFMYKGEICNYIVHITKQVCIEKGLPSLGIKITFLIPEVCQAVHGSECVYVTFLLRL